MKKTVFLSLLLAGSLLASAQTQGYKDGIEYYKAGQYDNARTILERTINDATTDKSLANYYLGQVALVQGDKAAAKSYFDKGLSLNPDNAYNYVGIGALDLLNGQADAASDQFKRAQKLAKKNAEISVSIARAYYNADPVKYAKDIQKNIDKARKDSKNQDPSIYVLEGDMMMDAKDYGAAAAKYENAIFNRSSKSCFSSSPILPWLSVNLLKNTSWQTTGRKLPTSTASTSRIPTTSRKIRPATPSSSTGVRNIPNLSTWPTRFLLRIPRTSSCSASVSSTTLQ